MERRRGRRIGEAREGKGVINEGVGGVLNHCDTSARYDTFSFTSYVRPVIYLFVIYST